MAPSIAIMAALATAASVFAAPIPPRNSTEGLSLQALSPPRHLSPSGYPPLPTPPYPTSWNYTPHSGQAPPPPYGPVTFPKDRHWESQTINGTSHLVAFDPLPWDDRIKPLGCLQFTNADNTTDNMCFDGTGNAKNPEFIERWESLLSRAQEEGPKVHLSTYFERTPSGGALPGWNCVSKTVNDKFHVVCFPPEETKVSGCIDYGKSEASREFMCIGEWGNVLYKLWPAWIAMPLMQNVFLPGHGSSPVEES